MEFVTCPNCQQQNPSLRIRCERCGEVIAAIAEVQASMPRATSRLLSDERRLPVPVVPDAFLGSGALELGIIVFSNEAQWLLPPQPVDTITGLPPHTPGGMTDLGAGLDLVAGLEGARVLISDCDVTHGQEWSQCLSRITAEHAQLIRWGVVGIRESGCSWNPEARLAASHERLFTESACDARLARALLHVTGTIVEIDRPNALHVLLDTSGSMKEGSKWHAACSALAILVQELQTKARKPVTSTVQTWTA